METVISKNEIETSHKEFILSNYGNAKEFGILKLLKYKRGRIPKLIDFFRENWNFIIGVDLQTQMETLYHLKVCIIGMIIS